LYDWLLRRGVELYEYRKNVLHSKIAISDDEWVTVGSYNLNNLSAYASLELNLDVRHPGFVKNVRERVDDIIRNDCMRILPEQLKRSRNIFIRLCRWLSYQFIRLTIHLFTFYFKHHN
jgi:cardiolipin synthase